MGVVAPAKEPDGPVDDGSLEVRDVAGTHGFLEDAVADVAREEPCLVQVVVDDRCVSVAAVGVDDVAEDAGHGGEVGHEPLRDDDLRACYPAPVEERGSQGEGVAAAVFEQEGGEEGWLAQDVLVQAVDHSPKKNR